jgi:hypothetical protein
LASTATIRELADVMAETFGREAAPLPFLLGPGCAEAAEVPPLGEVLRRGLGDPGLIIDQLPAEGAESELAAVAYRLLGTLSTSMRDAVRRYATADLPVPQFHQDLAVLLREGYANTVWTTSYDNLLERALVGAGLRQGRDFAVAESPAEITPSDGSASGIRIVKVIGWPPGDAIPRDCSGVVAVGYDFHDAVLNEWLGYTERVWCVASPQAQADSPTICQEQIDATVDDFFGNLAVLLIDIPANGILSASLSNLASSWDDAGWTDDVEMPSAASPAAFAAASRSWGWEDDSEVHILRARLKRCQETLYRLAQESATGRANPVLARQIEYQHAYSIGLEDRLLRLDGTRDEVLAVLHSIRAAVGDHAIEGFMDDLIGRIDIEYQADEPNGTVLGSTLGAVVIAAGRAGVDDDLVRQLGQVSGLSSVMT